MNWNRFFVPILLSCALAINALASDSPTNSLTWHKQSETVDADVDGWTLRQLLEQVASATGWRIYVESSAKRNVSAKFEALPAGQALHNLLGDLSFALVPETNAPFRLYVFRTARQQATTLIKPIRKIAKPIPGQLVVTLKPNAKTKIEDLARSLHAKIIGRMDAQHAYLLQFEDDAAAQLARADLANNPDVASVDANYPMEAPPRFGGR